MSGEEVNLKSIHKKCKILLFSECLKWRNQSFTDDYFKHITECSPRKLSKGSGW